ncbi:hypothetical protein BGX26_012414 [Mortierella sp. AD094]|nr:hypothetical protein BGX26_012414 [Mortierella sp. AD094]
MAPLSPNRSTLAAVNRDNASTYTRKNAHRRLQNNNKATSVTIKADSNLPIEKQYKQAILDVCMSAYHLDVDSLTEAIFSYHKDEKLGCCDTILPSDGYINTKSHLESLIPDPDLSHPISRRVAPEIIRHLRGPTTPLTYTATAAAQLSYHAKVLMETLSFHHAIPKPSQEASSSDVGLAAAFMRSTGSGPLESPLFDGCHYEWAAQYQAVRLLGGVGKSDKTISLRKEYAKPLMAMHSQVCVYRAITTDRSMMEDPEIRDELYSYVHAFFSDSDWLEGGERQQDTNQQHRDVIENCRFSNMALNATFGYEKICEVEWQERKQLIKPGWICTVKPKERQRLIAAACYSDFGVNAESHSDLMEDEGLRSRSRLRCMILGCQFDSYDEWASGETNMCSALCSDCSAAEVRVSCSPACWDSEEYHYADRSSYGALAYFLYSARHNNTMGRLLRFQAHDVKDILRSYGYVPESTLKGKHNDELMATIVSDVGIEIHQDEFSDQIAQQYDWAKVSGMCTSCSQNGGATDWYLATLGFGLGSSQLSPLEKVRLGNYLDAAGLNVLPALHRSFASGCGCVGRWIKRMFILSVRASNLYTPADFSTAFALRDALADSVKGLSDDDIAALLSEVNIEVQRGRQSGQEYRKQKEALLAQK